MRRLLLGGLLLPLPLMALAACGDEPPVAHPAHPPLPAAAAPAAAAPAAAAAGRDGGADGGDLALPLRDFQEKDFTESDTNRDPFRTYTKLFVTQAKAKVVLQRKVLVDNYALDELKLVGVVSRGDPRAMLIDPKGFGWIAQVGDFVGRAEIVHAGGPNGSDVAINWRVDRIRELNVVFVREDPSHPEIPATTHVVALHLNDDDRDHDPNQ